jgi:hypothetical protein
MLVLLAVVLNIRFFMALGTQIFSYRGMVVVLSLSFPVVATDTPPLLFSFGLLIVVSLPPLLIVV